MRSQRLHLVLIGEHLQLENKTRPEPGPKIRPQMQGGRRNGTGQNHWAPVLLCPVEGVEQFDLPNRIQQVDVVHKVDSLPVAQAVIERPPARRQMVPACVHCHRPEQVGAPTPRRSPDIDMALRGSSVENRTQRFMQFGIASHHGFVQSQIGRDANSQNQLLHGTIIQTAQSGRGLPVESGGLRAIDAAQSAVRVLKARPGVGSFLTPPSARFAMQFARGRGGLTPYTRMKMTTSPSRSTVGLTYRDAGVDIDAGDALVDRIKPLARTTLRDGVLAGIGGFGALFEVPKRYREPVLVSGTDGVGTKLKLAFQLDRHDTVGIDLVAMSVNDILVQGAEPLFFLDYFACGRLHVDTAAAVISGVAEGCRIAGCALIGGETAEMPSMYPDGEYDLAGFAVGVVEKSRIIDGHSIRAGDAVIALASSGPHSNGYSLIRRIVEVSRADLSATFGTVTLGDALLAPTRIYVKPVFGLLEHLTVKGIAHITGGGIVENIPRVIPDHLSAEIRRDSWQLPAIFEWLQAEGHVDDAEMHRVFNCGIGMVLIVPADEASRACELLLAAGEQAWIAGTVCHRAADEAKTIVR